MTNAQIIRAWKDEEYRSGLTDAEKAMLPPSPAGIVEIQEENLSAAGGITAPDVVSCVATVTVRYTCLGDCNYTLGGGSCAFLTVICCGPLPF